MEIQIEIPHVLTYNRSNSVVVVPSSETTPACKLELSNDLEGSDIDIDCQIKDARKVKVESVQLEPECELRHLIN